MYHNWTGLINWPPDAPLSSRASTWRRHHLMVACASVGKKTHFISVAIYSQTRTGVANGIQPCKAAQPAHTFICTHRRYPEADQRKIQPPPGHDAPTSLRRRFPWGFIPQLIDQERQDSKTTQLPTRRRSRFSDVDVCLEQLTRCPWTLLELRSRPPTNTADLLA